MPAKELFISDLYVCSIIYDSDNTFGIISDQQHFYRWLNDLRSGKYNKLKHTLRDVNNKNNYCTIGLLFKKQIIKLDKAAAENDSIEFDVDSKFIEMCEKFNNITVHVDGYKYSISDFILELNDSIQPELTFIEMSYILEYIHRLIRDEDTREVLSILQTINREWKLLLF